MMNLHHVFFHILPALLLCSRAAHQSDLETIEVRLINGSSQYEGTVQYSGDNGLSWHTVCGANLDINVVKVICRQLGFSGANRNIRNSPFGIGNEPLTTGFNCAGVEQTIAACNKYNTTCSSNGRQPGAAVCYDKRYLGCFNNLPNNRVLLGNILQSELLTIESCIMYCRRTPVVNYVYAGVKGGYECNCGDASADYGRHGMVGDDGCQLPCTGDAYSSCGGNGKIAIFNLSVVIPPSDKKTTDATSATTNSILSTRPEMTTGFKDTSTTTSTKFGAGVGGSFMLITIIVIIVVFVKYKRRLKHGSSQGIAASGEPQESPGIEDNPTFESSNVHDLRISDVAGCHGGIDLPVYIALTTPHGGPNVQVYEPLREVNSQGDGYEVSVNRANGQTGSEFQVHPETDYEITHEYQDITNSEVGRNSSHNESPIRGLQVKPETDYEAIHDYENPGIIG